jgi:hypothetical protein
MINRIKLLLDPHFIRFTSDCYQWSLDAESEYQALSNSKQEDVDAYRRGVSYRQTAVDLVNVEFKNTVTESKMGLITIGDLKRSWRIVSRRAPKDPLGLAYTWFITRISLYVPDRKGQVHRPMSDGLTRQEIIDTLFHQFLDWAETNNYLGALSPIPENPAFIDEIEGLFVGTIDVLTENNLYVQQIFKDTPIEKQMTMSTLNKETRNAIVEAYESTQQQKAN